MATEYAQHYQATNYLETTSIYSHLLLNYFDSEKKLYLGLKELDHG